MQYLCLVYHDDQLLAALSASARDALAHEARDYEEELRRSGQLMVSEAAECAPTTLTIRVRQGRTAIAEGPCAAAVQRPDRVLMIAARDLNEAIRVAERLPAARLGSVEVRALPSWRGTDH